MRNQLTIAAAVAMALGAATAAQADSCSAPTYALYVGGSSAAKNSFSTALKSDLFGGTITSYSSTNGDFEAFCGAVASGTGATATGFTVGATAIVFYRAEGGSVVGALPIVSGYSPKFLDLTGSGCNVTNPVTTGTSATVGTTDGWGGCVTAHAVEMGVTDLEPSVFVSSAGNYPTAYSTTVWGSASPSALSGLTSTELFQQVFGIFVNTSGISPSGCTTTCGTTGQALNLSVETVANILSGKYKNWEYVPSTSGVAVSTSSVTIHIKNREAGSGTRSGASIYFLGQECSTNPVALSDGAASADFYATSDVLAAAASQQGTITYASIDNLGKQANLSLVSLAGVTPTNLAAAEGQYDWWFEATAQQGTISSNGGTALYTWLTGGELQALASAPHAADILAIPGLAGNSGTLIAGTGLASSVVGGKTIYVNPFTRSGNSCNIPVEANE